LWADEWIVIHEVLGHEPHHLADFVQCGLALVEPLLAMPHDLRVPHGAHGEMAELVPEEVEVVVIATSAGCLDR
jgi:hypothetical protein